MFQSLLDRLADIRRALGSAIGGFFWWLEGIRQVPRQLFNVILSLGRALVWVLMTPWFLLRGVGRAFGGLRSGGEMISHSVQAMGQSMSESAAGFREAVETEPQKFQGRFVRGGRTVRTWFQNKPGWYRGIVYAGLACLLIGAASAYPAWLWVKDWRAENLLKNADALFAEGRNYQAFLKGQAAHYVNPDNPEVLARLIEYSRMVGHPMTLEYGEQLMAQGEVPAGALAALTDEAQRRRSPELARAFLRRLERIDPGHAEIPRLRMQVAILDGQYQQAYALGRRLVEDGEASPMVFGLYVNLGLEIESGAELDRLVDSLWQAMEEADEYSLYAAMLLLRHHIPEGPEATVRVARHLLDHPDSSREQKLGAQGIRLQAGQVGFDEMREEVRALFDLSDAEDRVQYAGWLMGQGLSEEILESFSRAEFSDDRILFSLYALALIERGQAQEALELVRSSDAFVMSEIERLILEARILQSLEREEAYRATVERAIARGDVADYQTLERFLRPLNDRDFLIAFYDKYAGFPSTATASDARLLLIAYNLRDAERVEVILERVWVQEFREHAAAQSLVAYLKGLKGSGTLDNIREMEALVADNPGVIDFRVALAVNYFQNGYLREAGEVLDGVRLGDLDRVPGMRLIAQSIVWVSQARFGQAPAGVDLASQQGLLPLERQFLEEVLKIPFEPILPVAGF